MRKKFLPLFVLFFLLLTACSSVSLIEKELFSSQTTSLSKADVLKKLGKPHKILSNHFEEIFFYRGAYVVLRKGMLSHYVIQRKTNTYHYVVNALAVNHTQPARIYMLQSLDDKSVQNNDLQYIEFARYIKNMLKNQGYIETDNIERAQIFIRLHYSMSDPIFQTFYRNKAIYGTVGWSDVYYPIPPSSIGLYPAPYFPPSIRWRYGYGGTPYYPSVMPLGIFDIEESKEIDTFYTAQLTLTALDAKTIGSKNEKQLWKTTIETTQKEGDLRFLFPYLVVGVQPYLAQDTHRQVQWLISENDPLVTQLRTQK